VKIVSTSFNTRLSAKNKSSEYAQIDFCTPKTMYVDKLIHTSKGKTYTQYLRESKREGKTADGRQQTTDAEKSSCTLKKK
jgi:hypothetical protein